MVTAEHGQLVPHGDLPVLQRSLVTHSDVFLSFVVDVFQLPGLTQPVSEAFQGSFRKYLAGFEIPLVKFCSLRDLFLWLFVLEFSASKVLTLR